MCDKDRQSFVRFDDNCDTKTVLMTSNAIRTVCFIPNVTKFVTDGGICDIDFQLEFDCRRFFCVESEILSQTL